MCVYLQLTMTDECVTFTNDLGCSTPPPLTSPRRLNLPLPADNLKQSTLGVTPITAALA